MNSTDISFPHRSAFVTAIAWIFIIVSGLATAISLMQNITFFNMLNAPTMHAPMHEGASGMPLLIRLIFDHFQLYLATILLLSLASLAAAVGLLMRKNWARLLFSTLLAVGILSLVAGLATQISLAPVAENIPASQIPLEARTMLRVMKGFLFIITISVGTLFGWIIARLGSP
ncbi:MAG: hypothetical protein OEV91_11570, partial [Desulfobulbaceae bacterium]|nr:hypothetical protein [Desulfobulbaceae bacterium]